jgi:hypothetical protein
MVRICLYIYIYIYIQNTSHFKIIEYLWPSILTQSSPSASTCTCVWVCAWLSFDTCVYTRKASDKLGYSQNWRYKYAVAAWALTNIDFLDYARTKALPEFQFGWPNGKHMLVFIIFLCSHSIHEKKVKCECCCFTATCVLGQV